MEYARKYGCEAIVHTAKQSRNSLRRLNGAIAQPGFAGYCGTPYMFSAISREEKIDELRATGLDKFQARGISGDANLWCREFESGSLDNPETFWVPESLFDEACMSSMSHSAPMRQDIQNNPCFAAALFRCADVLPPVPSCSSWWVQVFQNRILATPDQQGKPTPEGVHRDGVDYVLTLMVGRNNVIGGESSTYAQDGRTLLASVTLAEPGDFILLDDRRTKHGVEPIGRRDAADVGHRDALIAMFTQRVGADPVPA